MANTLYPTFKTYLLSSSSGPDLDNASVNVKAVLVDLADYTYSPSHEFLSDVPSGARVATSSNLASKAVSAGAFDAADFSFSAVIGDPSEALILYIDTGSAATSRLIAFYDTGVTGLPVTPNGGDINVTVNGSGFFTL